MKKIRLNWDEEKQSRCVNNWMKVIFSDELRICIGQDDEADEIQIKRINMIV